jgi:dTDP-glucose pyrophosphorylase/CBS domain-containing protein
MRHLSNDVFVHPDCSLHNAMQALERNVCGIVLVVDDARRLLGTLTDGDIRRAILAGQGLDASVSVALRKQGECGNRAPIVAPIGSSERALLQLMKEHRVRQIPLVNASGQVADLASMDAIVDHELMPIEAVIMAGGLGTRLRPLTDHLPKPMLPVGNKPLMEWILGQLREIGIRKINISTHYKPEKIVEHFGDGRAYGVELKYVHEDEPLGTGGALSLLTVPTSPLLVINGDVLSEVNLSALIDYHKENKADLTVGVRRIEFEVPYGVVECDGPDVTSLKEKPRLGVLINAGIYLLDPKVFDFITEEKHFDMPDLVHWLMAAKRKVVGFPIAEMWIDIGQPAEYARAQEYACVAKFTPAEV